MSFLILFIFLYYQCLNNTYSLILTFRFQNCFFIFFFKFHNLQFVWNTGFGNVSTSNAWTKWLLAPESNKNLVLHLNLLNTFAAYWLRFFIHFIHWFADIVDFFVIIISSSRHCLLCWKHLHVKQPLLLIKTLIFNFVLVNFNFFSNNLDYTKSTLTYVTVSSVMRHIWM